MNKLKKMLLAIGYWLLAPVVFAQSPTGGGGGVSPTGGGRGVSPSGDLSLPNPLKVGTLVELIDRVIFYLTIIAAPIVAIMVIVGAFQILTAAGDPEKFKTGKRTILYAAIGFAVILVARGLIAIIQNLLGVQETIPTQSAF